MCGIVARGQEEISDDKFFDCPNLNDSHELVNNKLLMLEENVNKSQQTVRYDMATFPSGVRDAKSVECDNVILLL